MDDSHEDPLSGGEEGFSLQGWVLPVPEQPTPAPLQRRGIIFMLNGAALLLKILPIKEGVGGCPFGFPMPYSQQDIPVASSARSLSP
ncbi:MAG: hypothetical protein DMG06_20975 [Acidobacteria bacterium]|nr:MAG: hypothetical protein DMG06_20975 [Acidobacteriota bacterium]